MGKVGEKGKHEQLVAFAACGWRRNDDSTKRTHLDFWDWRSTAGCFKGKRNDFIVENKITFATYMLESGHDLLLSSEDNVSESPGFEKHAKQNGRGQMID